MYNIMIPVRRTALVLKKHISTSGVGKSQSSFVYSYANHKAEEYFFTIYYIGLLRNFSEDLKNIFFFFYILIKFKNRLLIKKL